jgi:hypothetical protein
MPGYLASKASFLLIRVAPQSHASKHDPHRLNGVSPPQAGYVLQMSLNIRRSLEVRKLFIRIRISTRSISKVLADAKGKDGRGIHLI